MVGGWESERQARSDQTVYLTVTPCLSVCACVFVSVYMSVCGCERVSPLPSQTIEQALCLIGVSWWLPRGEKEEVVEEEERSEGGWVVGIRHRCLTCVSGLGGRGTKNQTAL